MNIIPVIDYMHGQVVLAERGMRAKYQPIKSELCKKSDIHSVLKEILSLANFTTVYVADLDSIENQKLNHSLWKQLFNSYPNIQFWCDFGTCIARWGELMNNVPNARPVIGSESFRTIQDLNKTLHNIQDSRPLLSLDYKDGILVGPRNLLTDFAAWPQEVIILSLNRVGSSQGPDFQLIHSLLKRLAGYALYLGGGIRNTNDIRDLQLSGVAGVLLAKSLHLQSISAQDLANFID